MYKSQSMSDVKTQDNEGLPKGRVNEVCQEWMVREDGALAYRLQTQEFHEHLSGNRHRNALVREDFPRAKNEQLREQQLAEQTAVIYQRMLAEQEEHDKMVAKQLAEELEREERLKRRVLEGRDQDVARQLLERERSKGRHRAGLFLPERNPGCHGPNLFYNYQVGSPKRQAKPMPLPQEVQGDVYVEPYKCPEVFTGDFEKINIVDEVGLPIVCDLDELNERQIQEKQDAELARQLQEREGSLEDTLLNRDRLMAIEAQDKELAKLLQERERAKARKARERAKQKSLTKKQQQQKLESQQALMPDDSYSYPVDLIPSGNYPATKRHVPGISDVYDLPDQCAGDLNYSTPIDMLPPHSCRTAGGPDDGPQRGCEARGDKTINCADCSSVHPSFNRNKSADYVPPVRPNRLDLRSPLNRITKPRYPEAESCENSSEPSSASSPSQHINIAMIIDPTYPRKNNMASSSSFDTSSGTVTTSTSSSSPGIVLPPPDVSEIDNDNNVAPPYMPIQGQRRTMSLEKKQKRKSKDGGCKQQ